MSLLDKVKRNVRICGIELSFDATVLPSSIVGWQLFYNSTFLNNDFAKLYVGLSTIDFDEESISSASGISYKQKATIKFPVTDEKRSERIALLQTLKFLKFKLTNGLDIVIGRNDYFQNTLPVVKVKLDQQFALVEIECLSIAPSGYTPNINAFGLPSAIPLTLI